MFDELLARIARALDAWGIPYMAIGGQAVLVYGEPRLTRDIDLTFGVDVDALVTVLEATASGLDCAMATPTASRPPRPGWTAGRVRRGPEAEDAEIEFWLSAPPSIRLAAVWQMVEERWLMEGVDGPPPRLERSLFGVRRGRG